MRVRRIRADLAAVEEDFEDGAHDHCQRADEPHVTQIEKERCQRKKKMRGKLSYEEEKMRNKLIQRQKKIEKERIPPADERSRFFLKRWSVSITGVVT